MEEGADKKKETKKKIIISYSFYITDRSKAVHLIWFSVFACFGVSFCGI